MASAKETYDPEGFGDDLPDEWDQISATIEKKGNMALKKVGIDPKDPAQIRHLYDLNAPLIKPVKANSKSYTTKKKIPRGGTRRRARSKRNPRRKKTKGRTRRSRK